MNENGKIRETKREQDEFIDLVTVQKQKRSVIHVS